MKNFRTRQIIPNSNTMMKTEIPAMLTSRYAEFPDERFTFYSVRMRTMYVTPEELKNMDVVDDRYALKLGDAYCDVMAYACLVVITNQDHGYHRVPQERLTKVTEQNNTPTPVLSSVGALIDTIYVQGYRKVTIVTPHVKPLTQAVINYIKDSSIKVTDSISLEVSDNLAVGRLGPANLVGRVSHPNISGADAAVLPTCVQMPSLPSIQVIEDRLDRPVFSAATSTVYQILKTLGPKTKIPSAGYLLSGTF